MAEWSANQFYPYVCVNSNQMYSYYFQGTGTNAYRRTCSFDYDYGDEFYF